MIKTHVGGFIIRTFLQDCAWRLEVRDDQHNLFYYGKKITATREVAALLHLEYCATFETTPFLNKDEHDKVLMNKELNDLLQ